MEKQVVGGGRRYAKCLYCGSTDRERLVYLYLKNHTDIFQKMDKKVLHIAPERNLKKVLKLQFDKGYIAADKLAKGYCYARNTIQMDITAIQFPNNTFDLIICNHVLEHIVDDNLAISELYRVLTPNGIAILQSPVSKILKQTYQDFTITTPQKRKKHFGQFDHVRIYGQDYTNRLEKGGFTVTRANISTQYTNNALNPDEDIFVGNKKTSPPQ
jgi:SAM-dependent methyltransferase